MRWFRRSQDAQEAPLTPEERRDEVLSAYLDDELSDAELTEVESLLASDADARETLEDFRLLTSALGNLGEIRAPRSFAIAAPQVRASRLSGLFTRMEMGMRVSAAAAALLFVVVLTNQPGSETPVGTFTTSSAPEHAESEFRTAGAEPGMADDAEAGAAGLMPMPAPEDGAGGGTDAGEANDGVGAFGVTSEDPDDARVGAMAPDAPVTNEDDAKDGDPEFAPAGDTAAFAPPPAGTFEMAPASESVGGVAPALAILAGLFAALSILTAWTRRGRGSAPR